MSLCGSFCTRFLRSWLWCSDLGPRSDASRGRRRRAPGLLTLARRRRRGLRIARLNRGRAHGSCGSGFGLDLVVVVFLQRTSTHDGRPNSLFDDVLLLFLVDGSLHAFDVDWF